MKEPRRIKLEIANALLNGGMSERVARALGCSPDIRLGKLLKKKFEKTAIESALREKGLNPRAFIGEPSGKAKRSEVSEAQSFWRNRRAPLFKY